MTLNLSRIASFMLPGLLYAGIAIAQAVPAVPRAPSAAAQGLGASTRPVPPAPVAPLRPGRLDCPERPDYPAAAMRANAMGTTHVALLIGNDGITRDAYLEQPSGDTREHGLMDVAALQSMRKCRFDFTNKESFEGTYRTSVEYVWKLDADPPTGQFLQQQLKAAERGSASASLLLAEYYEGGPAAARDPGLSRSWLAKAAQQGSAIANWRLGQQALQGDDAARDDARAVEWLATACTLGHGPACLTSAHLAREGRGQAPSAERAFEWLARGAARGDYAAMMELADAYHRGIGTARNDAQAEALCARLAGRNHGPALARLAVARLEGWSGPPDPFHALVYMHLAERAGYPAGMSRSAEASAQLEPARLIEAERLARDWPIVGTPLPR